MTDIRAAVEQIITMCQTGLPEFDAKDIEDVARAALAQSEAQPAAQEPAECYSGARSGGKAYLPPEQQLRDALTAMGSTKAQELSAGDLMQVVCDVDSGRAEPAALSELCQPNGLMFDALGQPRTRYVRVSLGGNHCVMHPSEGDSYLQEARDSGDESSYVVADVYLSEREFDDLPEHEGF